MNFVVEYWFEILTGIIALILLINTAVLSKRLKAYKKLTKLLKGGSIEAHMLKLEEHYDRQGKILGETGREIAQLKEHVSTFPHNWHLLRYNAFDKTGSDLSFSFALLNDQGDGLVMTGIFGREDTRVYAKPVSGGLSEYTLSEEENKAIKVAMEKVR